jgi:hypothetical protein
MRVWIKQNGTRAKGCDSPHRWCAVFEGTRRMPPSGSARPERAGDRSVPGGRRQPRSAGRAALPPRAERPASLTMASAIRGSVLKHRSSGLPINASRLGWLSYRIAPERLDHFFV